MPDAAKPTKIPVDLRAWALATWSREEKPGVNPRDLMGAHARHVATMEGLGWTDRREGLLYLNDQGRSAIAALLPAKLPKLSAPQEELLEDVLRGKSTSCDIGYAPATRLVAIGMLDIRPQSLSGGFRLIPTERAHEWDAGRDDPGDEPSSVPGM